MDRNLGQMIAEIRMRKREFYLFTVPLSFATILVVKWLSEYLWGFGDSKWTGKELLGFFAFSFLFVVVHELLHALAFFYWGKIPIKAIKFGCIWKEFLPYCDFSGSVEIQSFRVVLLLPFVCTSLLALVCLWMYPSSWTAIFTGCTIATSLGDILTFIKIRRFSGHLFLTDHPLGYQIFAPSTEGRVGEDQKGSSDPDRKEPS